jgi:hypothetical protein
MEAPLPWHAQSLFTAGPRRIFTLGDRALWLARLHTARLSRAITAAHAEVARALLRRLGEDGRLDPGYATLAADTGLDERTIGRAIRRLAEASLLTWQRRLVRVGWRAAQSSNAYELVPAGQPLPPPPLKHRESGSKGSLSVAGESLADQYERQRAAVREWVADGVTNGATCRGTASYKAGATCQGTGDDRR